MKTIAIALDDDLYRLAETRAAKDGASLAAVVERLLVEYAAGETDVDAMKRDERRLRDQIVSFSAADRLPREELYRRR